MKSTLKIDFKGEKINVNVQELLYHENTAWQIGLSDGKQFMLKDDKGRWVLLKEDEVDPELKQAIGRALGKASDAGRGPFANDDIPAPPAELF